MKKISLVSGGTFRDIVRPGLKVLFVGLNPSPVSLAKGHYLQGILGKRLWRRLKEHAILTGAVTGREDEALLRHGFGITDLSKKPSARAHMLSPEDFERGRLRLQRLIQRNRPQIVCFVYKTGAEKFLRTKLKGAGLQKKKEFAGTKIFVLPSVYAQKKTERALMRQFRKTIGK